MHKAITKITRFEPSFRAGQYAKPLGAIKRFNLTTWLLGKRK